MASELKQYCRVCAQRNSDLIPVFGEEGSCRQLMLKLKHCLQVIVLESDILPTTICWKCVGKLEVCFELMQDHIKGENEFRKRLFSHQILPMKTTYIKINFHDGDETRVDQKMEPTNSDGYNYENPPKCDDAIVPCPAASPECELQHTNLCQCEQCVCRYGNLPLLAEAVETNNFDNCSLSPVPGVANVIGDNSCSLPQLPEIANVIGDDSCSNSPHGHNKTELSTATPVTTKKVHEAGGPIRVTKKIMSCEFCNKAFNHTGDLNKHRRKHTGERPYPCLQCDRSFSHASNLIRHQKIHSGEMPHQCTTCGKRFSRKDKMMNHMRNTHRRQNL